MISQLSLLLLCRLLGHDFWIKIVSDYECAFPLLIWWVYSIPIRLTLGRRTHIYIDYMPITHMFGRLPHGNLHQTWLLLCITPNTHTLGHPPGVWVKTRGSTIWMDAPCISWACSCAGPSKGGHWDLCRLQYPTHPSIQRIIVCVWLLVMGLFLLVCTNKCCCVVIAETLGGPAKYLQVLIESILRIRLLQ